MFGWFQKYIRKINIFGVGVELHPPSDASNNLISSELTEVEVLPELQRKFGTKLRSALSSVKFCQRGGRCLLRLTTIEIVAGYLQNELVTQDDLGFVTDDNMADGLYFSPLASISENARRLLQDFDEASIIHCTNLFTDDTANQVNSTHSQ